MEPDGPPPEALAASPSARGLQPLARYAGRRPALLARIAALPRSRRALAARDGVESDVERREADAETFAEARAFDEAVAGLVAAAVATDAGAVLFVHHEDYGGWVLPGGRVEAGESLRAAAVREVREESGVVATVTRPLLVVEFVTAHDGRETSTHFVLFAASAEDATTADDPGLDDEPITDVQWFDSVPEAVGGDETVQRSLAVVVEQFDWFDWS